MSNQHEQDHHCDHHGDNPAMCSCDHNPGGECHCPPNECKCDQRHHMTGETQHGHNCCATDGNHDQPVSGSDHSSHDHSVHDHGSHDHSAHDHHDHSHHDPEAFKRQFWMALALTIPTMAFSHTVLGFFGLHWSFPFMQLIPALFGTILFFTGGRVFLSTGWAEIKAKRPGMMALIALAITVAFVYSLFITVVTTVGLPWQGMDFWWELAALITIMLLGHWIEMSSIMRASDALGALAKLLPDEAELVTSGLPEKISVDRLKVGDLVLVRPGAACPADGEVVEGSSKVNEAMITGESAPVLKEPGSKMIAGTINATSDVLGEGALTVRVNAVGDGTVLSGIMRLVAEAQASKSKTQVLADKAAGWLFYLALGASLITAGVWMLLGTQTPDFVLERVVTVLVIACPHALGLAIPLVNSITTAKAASQGILIRERRAFEALRNVDVVLFDKTGTLTTGERGFVAAHLSYGSILKSTDDLVALAAGVEKFSEHSIGQAIFAESQRRRLEVPTVTDFRTVPGQGVTGVIEAKNILVGGPVLLTSRNIDIHVSDLVKADAANHAGNTVVYVVLEGRLLGYIELGDVIRETSEQAVYALRLMRKRVGIVTGDAEGVATAVSKKLGIGEVYAEVLPHQKADLVKQVQQDRSRVAMVGDGVNDAPALVQAEVGIAIGAGTDVAIESAGLVLISNDPTAVPQAMDLSRRSYAKMVQNLIWGAGYNIIAIPLAAGLFMPFGLVLSPALGAVLMSLSTIVVALNAQLLRRPAKAR
jgi:Cu2+-exporting ATPase